MNEAAREFGEALRRERERRGITLDRVAEATKISATVMAGLERGDLLGWPNGLFRRAFVRAYADAVGLPVESTVRTFIDVYGQEGRPPKPAETRRIDRVSVGGPNQLRLRLAGEPRRPLSTTLSHGLGIGVDLVLPGVLGAAASLVAGVPAAVGVGAAACCYLVASSVFGQQTLGHALVRRWTRAQAVASPETSVAPETSSVDMPGAVVDAEPRRLAEPFRTVARSRRSARERARAHRTNHHA